MHQTLTASGWFLPQEGPQDGSDPDGLSGGGHRVPHRVPQPRPGREPPPTGLLLQVLHLSLRLHRLNPPRSPESGLGVHYTPIIPVCRNRREVWCDVKLFFKTCFILCLRGASGSFKETEF